MSLRAGRVAIVTGAGRGIGREEAIALAQRHGPSRRFCAADITGQTCIVYGGIVAHVRLPRRRNELFKEVGPSAYEGPRGNAKLPAH